MRFVSFRKCILVTIFILLAVGSLLPGCGKKAPPRAPIQKQPPAAVKDLIRDINGDMLTLAWSSPGGKDTAVSEVAGYYVYRSKNRLSAADCRKCPILFRRIAVIPVDRLDPKKLMYREALENGYRYIYKVAAYSNNGAIGRDSNLIDFYR